MSIFDLAVLICMVVNILLSMWRGLISEAINFSSWIVALIASWVFYPIIAQTIFSTMENRFAASAAAFALLFFAVRIAMHGIRNLLNSLIDASPLNFINRILGACLGTIKAIFIITALVALSAFTALPESDAWQSAFSSPYFEQLALSAASFLPDFWAERISDAFFPYSP